MFKLLATISQWFAGLFSGHHRDGGLVQTSTGTDGKTIDNWGELPAATPAAEQERASLTD